MVLLNISNLSWVPNRLKRNQAIFIHLLDCSPDFESGVFVNPPRLDGNGFNKYTAPQRFASQSWHTSKGKPVIILDSTYTLWDWYVPAIRQLHSHRMASYLRQTVMGGQPYLLWLNTAGRLQTPVAKLLQSAAAKTIFDLSDDFRAPGFGMKPFDLASLTNAADVVLCVNDNVAASVPHDRKHVFYNCTDPSAFVSYDPTFRLDPWWPKPLGAVYIGFTGGIHWTRADLPLLEAVMLRFPAFRFLFVGYTDGPRITEWLSRFPNAAFIPEVPYTDLAHVIRSFDVGIIPHADNEYTRGNDLLKVLDYFACGIPVVTTRCSGVERYKDALFIAESANAFGDRIESLTTASLTHDPRRGEAIVLTQSWTAQVPSLTKWINAI